MITLNLRQVASNIVHTIVACFKKHPVVSIFLLAVSVRVLLLVFVPIPDHSGSDFPFYRTAALTFLETGGFGSVTYLAPGFSLYLALVFALLGTSAAVVVSAQLFLGALCAMLVYFIGRLQFTPSVSLAAGVITAAWPPILLETLSYGSSLLFYTVCVLAAIYFFTRAISVGRARWYALLSGALVGFAALTEPIAVYAPLVPVAWGIIYVLSDRKSFLTSMYRSALVVVLFCIGFVLVIAPWAYRNAVVFENAAHSVPIVVKQLETEVLSFEYVRSALHALIMDERASPLSVAAHMIGVPHNLSLLAADAPISYRDAVVQYLAGNSDHLFRGLDPLVLGSKVFLTLLHLMILGLASYAIVVRGTGGWGMLLLVVSGYILAALLILYASAGFTLNNISKAPNAYFAPVIPLCILLAVQGYSLLRQQLGFTLR